MELWVENLKWRTFGSQEGRDDGEFYLEKFAQNISQGVDWDFGPLKDLSSYRHSNSHFRIKKSLHADEWQHIMQILARIDVSQIEQMELELPQAPAETTLGDSVQTEPFGMEHLRPDLGSGRCSRLRTLRIGITMALREKGSQIALGSNGSAHLAEALRFGRFTNLRILSLPGCQVAAILGALKAGSISNLRSFSIISAGRFSPIKSLSVIWKSSYLRRDLSQNLGAVLKSGCFKSLEHLDLSGSPPILLSKSGCWKVFLRAIESGKLPNLTSLRLSDLSEVKFADIVLFMQSTPLENLIADGCGVNSMEVEHFAEAIMKATRSPLALKCLVVGHRWLNDTGFPALVRLVCSEKLAQLQELDLSDRWGMDLSDRRGMDSSALATLMGIIQSGHHPSLKLVIWSRNQGSCVGVAAAFLRLHDEDGARLPDEWYQVLYTPAQARNFSTGLSATNVTHYSVKKIQIKDIQGHPVDWNQDLPSYQQGSGSGARSRMDYLGTFLESSGCSTGEAVRLRITSEKPCDPEGLGEGQEGWAHLAGSLMTGQFTSLLSRSFPACGVSFLTLECDVSALLGPWNEKHLSCLRALSITSVEGLDDLSRSSLHQRLDAALKGGWLKSLQHLELCNGVLDGVDGWEVLIRAINSGNLPNIQSLRLSQNALNRINLEDLVPLLLSNSLVNLVLDGCWINSEQIWHFGDALLNGPGTGLALKVLDLHDNRLGNEAVDALVNLVELDFLPDLQILDLGMNKGIDFTAFKSVTETIQRGRLRSLETLIWVGNRVSDVGAEAMVQAYSESEDLTMTFDIEWTEVNDPALKTKVEEYRARNIRLRALRGENRELLKDVVPLTSAKIFLCGFPEVGKTTLRRALTQSTLETHALNEARTRGIEFSQLEERNMTLTLWDIAGQEEYRVLHGTFFADLGLASGKATIFVLVLRASFTKDVVDVETDLLYWFRFIASSSQKHVKRQVVVVLNCLSGQECTKADMILWGTLVKHFEDFFSDLLCIHLFPFPLDVSSCTSVQPLKEYLFGQAHILLQNVRVPRVCFELQEELKRWPQEGKNRHLPIMSWETFEKHINLKRKENQLSGKDLKAVTLFLNEIGGIIYFEPKVSTESGANNRSVVVLHPEWFCRQIVGELLLPEDMLEEGCSLIKTVSGSIPTYLFEGYFKHLLVDGTQSGDIILMLERLGLCYRKGNDKIMVPALIQEDDVSLIAEWEGEGSGVVIGRSLATEDHERTAIPMTLFRRLQVELAQDSNFGGRGDSGYRAGKFSSSFKVGELSFLIEVDANLIDPNDNRIDILVNTVDPTKESFSQVGRVCDIMEKLHVLCFACCPGLKYGIKVIKPWSATEKTPKIRERQLISLRELKNLVMDGKEKSGWRVSGTAVDLKIFLSDSEMKEVLEIKKWMKSGSDDGTAGGHVCEGAVEETEGIDYYYESEFSEGSEDSEVSLDGVEARENRDMSPEAVEDADQAADTKDLSNGCCKEDSLREMKEAEEGNSCIPRVLDTERASVEHQYDFLLAQMQIVMDLSLDTRSQICEALYREGNATRQHFDEGNQKLELHADERRDELWSTVKAHYSFSIAEKEKSVPRFLILKRKDCSGYWTGFKDTVKGPFRKDYRLHFLCESQFDDGKLHLVENQEGVNLSKTTVVKEWLKDVEPWVRWSYFVVTTVAKIALTVLVPGTAGAIPTISTSTEEHDRARDTAVTMLQEEDEQNHHGNPGPAEQLRGVKERLIAEGRGNVGSTGQLTDVKMKLIAEGVVKDLINDIGNRKFVEGTKLRRVLLKGTPQHESSRRSRPADSVLWVCENCLEKYGAEVTVINP